MNISHPKYSIRTKAEVCYPCAITWIYLSLFSLISLFLLVHFLWEPAVDMWDLLCVMFRLAVFG